MRAKRLIPIVNAKSILKFRQVFRETREKNRAVRALVDVANRSRDKTQPSVAAMLWIRRRRLALQEGPRKERATSRERRSIPSSTRSRRHVPVHGERGSQSREAANLERRIAQDCK
jgi:hypothetical protein